MKAPDNGEATGGEARDLPMSDRLTDAQQRRMDERLQLVQDGRRWDENAQGDRVTGVQ